MTAHESPDEAKKWLGRGDWTFGPEKCALFADSFYEIGWMPRPDVKKEEPKPADAPVATTPNLRTVPTPPSEIAPALPLQPPPQ